MSEANEVDGVVMCAFDEWYDRDSGWGPDRCSEYHLAKAAWNAAIDSATDEAAQVAYKECINCGTTASVALAVSDAVRYT